MNKASYKSRVRKTTEKLYKWDPRPNYNQGTVDIDRKNQFFKGLEDHNAFSGAMSMWETILRIDYKDFELDSKDIDYLKDVIAQFTKNLLDQCEELQGSSSSFCIPGTEKQA